MTADDRNNESSVGSGNLFEAGPRALSTCTACGRGNPSNRLNCLYCSAALEVDESSRANARLFLKPAEMWEKGHNLVLISAGNADIPRLAEMLSAEPDTLEKIG